MNKIKRLYQEFLTYLDLMNEEHYGFKGFLMQTLFIFAIMTFTTKILYLIFPYNLALSMDQDLVLLFSIWLVYIYTRIYVGRIRNEKKESETR